MKKFIRILFAFLLLNFMQTNANVEEINEKLKACNTRTSCVYSLVNEYYDVPDLKYMYALALIQDKRHDEAKKQLNELIRHSKSSQYYKNLSKQKLEEIDNLFDKMQEAKNNDYGDYLSDIKQTFTLPHSSSINVYVKGNTGNEYLLKRAFLQWDTELNQLVNFNYVENEETADIICSFVKSFEGDRVGVTYFDYDRTRRQYRPRIEISQTDNLGNPHTRSEVISVTLHEIGHALGLVGHSNNINDIMYYSTATYKKGKISRKDINTIRKLYQD